MAYFGLGLVCAVKSAFPLEVPFDTTQGGIRGGGGVERISSEQGDERKLGRMLCLKRV